MGCSFPGDEVSPSAFPARPSKGWSQPTFPDWSLKLPAERLVPACPLLFPQALPVLSRTLLHFQPQLYFISTGLPTYLCLLHEVSWVSAPLTALPRHRLVPAHGPVLGCVTRCPELQRTVCVASPSPCSDHGLREAGHTECALNEGNAPDHPQSGCDSNES